MLFRSMKQCWPLLLICLFLTLLALSNVVTLNSAILIDFKLPKIITNNLLGVVRASGRFFWPVFYLILLASFYILKTKKTKVALVLIILAIFCQTTDLSYKLKELGTGFEQKNWSNQIDSTDWQNIAKDYKHISFLPVIPHLTYISFILFAAQNKMTVNNCYFARPIKGLDQYIEKENNEVKAGIIKKDTIYILTRDSDTYLTNLDLNKHLLVLIYRTVALCSYYREVHPNTNYQNGQELKVNMAN